MSDDLSRGRDAFDKQAWGRAYEHLSAAAGNEALDVDDLERLASAAYLVGYRSKSSEVWTQAHRECARLGEVTRAARCGFWLAFIHLNNSETAQGSGWVDRARRLLDESRLDCVEQGLLVYAAALRSVFSGDLGAAHAGFSQSAKMGERFRDPELTALARIGEGRCLIYLGQVAEGVRLLDEAMVAVGAREVSPIAVGDAYCTAIEGYQELFDIARVQEWTAALHRWCETQPELVLYRGQCLIHRAEIMQLNGAWSDALDEARRACDRLASPEGQPARGAAVYLRAELARLRGDFPAAEESYRAANDLGRDPQPGLALLRLAQGRVADAWSAIRRVLDQAEDPLTRARLADPYVEILLAAEGDVAAARAVGEELAGVAAELNQPYLRALADQTMGAVLLAEGNPQGAVSSLRRAAVGWRDLGMPYEVARSRLLMGLACRALDDDDGAQLEFDAARSGFTSLGAGPDVIRTDKVARTAPPPAPGGLTAREVEVLVRVAQGKSNREIATELFISEKTVASHLSHMFTKLGLSSRAAATAYAYEQGLAR